MALKSTPPKKLKKKKKKKSEKSEKASEKSEWEKMCERLGHSASLMTNSGFMLHIEGQRTC